MDNKIKIDDNAKISVLAIIQIIDEYNLVSAKHTLSKLAFDLDIPDTEENKIAIQKRKSWFIGGFESEFKREYTHHMSCGQTPPVKHQKMDWQFVEEIKRIDKQFKPLSKMVQIQARDSLGRRITLYVKEDELKKN